MQKPRMGTRDFTIYNQIIFFSVFYPIALIYRNIFPFAAVLFDLILQPIFYHMKIL